MRARTYLLLAGAASIAYGSLLAPPRAEGQIDARNLQRVKVLSVQAASNYQVIPYPKEGAAAVAIAASKKAWAAALKIPGGETLARAGFSLPAIGTSGDIPGARVTARFTVSQVIGNSGEVAVGIRSVKNNLLGFVKKQFVTGPGTVTLSSESMTMRAGAEYEAWAWVQARGLGTGEVCAVVAIIPEIKWEF